jgi:N6-L-threonylcarbamoyladenine synthase
MLHSKDFNFSFSGLKTAVQTLLQKNASASPPDVAASFNKAVADVLTAKTLAAAQKNHLEKVVVAGGVACNSMLRSVLGEKAKPLGMEIYFPSPHLCTDNAAMIAHLGEKYLEAGIQDDLSLDAAARAEGGHEDMRT